MPAPNLNVRRLARHLAYRASVAADRLRGRSIVHMLHIGKTGGTAIKAAINGAESPTHRVIKHGHDVSLADLPEGDPFFFVVRDPVDRFVSGFKSRQRKGQPRRYVEWRPSEKEAFERFDSAEALALGLSSFDEQTRDAAERAFRHIGHVRDTYATWFGSWDALWQRRSDLVHALALERLDDDFDELKRKLSLPDDVSLPKDPVKAHRTTTPKPKLSETAAANLARWYAADYDFLDKCAEHFGTPHYDRPV